MTGSTPTGGYGGGTITYIWQKKAASTMWENISGATNKDYSPGTPFVNTLYRRVVNSGDATNISNEIAINVNPAPELKNNTITLQNGVMIGSQPTGVYNYTWTLLGGDTPYVYQETGQNFVIPSSTYDYLNCYPNLVIYRTVTSGRQSLGSNFVSIQSLFQIQNNTITANGYQINGSFPTGGNGTYNYSWSLFSPEAPIIFSETTKDLNISQYSNAINILEYYPDAVLVRTVKSGNKISNSNYLSLYNNFSAKSLGNIKVYPNPTTEFLSFDVDIANTTHAEIKVYNQSGENEIIIFKGNLSRGQIIKWNIPTNYQKGIYFYKIYLENQEPKTGKIIYQ